MVVKSSRPKDRKIKETLLCTLKNYLKSLALLKINLPPTNPLIALAITFFLNSLPALVPLKHKTCFYVVFISSFSFLNGFFLVLTEEGIEQLKGIEALNSFVRDLLTYSYITPLGLTYLPLYIYTSKLSSFLKPVSLIVYLGFYAIFFLNNAKKGNFTPVTNTICIFVFVYLCVDNI